MPELPLFPLNTVLFPGTPITLHIFEPRYKRMFNECIDNEEPFGVVLIKSGTEALGPLAEPHEIGCSARLTFVEKLTNERMNVVAVGEERFRILSTWQHDDHMMGEVEMLPLENEPSDELLAAKEELDPWVARYLRILTDANLVRSDISKLPNDPLEFVYLAAYLLQTPSGQKQTLLENSYGTELIDEVRTIYRKEVALLSTLIDAEPPKDEDGIASLN